MQKELSLASKLCIWGLFKIVPKNSKKSAWKFIKKKLKNKMEKPLTLEGRQTKSGAAKGLQL
jgi:hypothetical protein